MEWVIHMLEQNRFRSFLAEPPCTTFSPAAYPCLRSYRQPYGFDRLHPRVVHGNCLAFRSLVLLRVGARLRRRCGLEQPRRSKMRWLDEWWSLVEAGLFEEAVIAACNFNSPHQKEFVFLFHGILAGEVEAKCTRDHPHVRIRGLTKKSAIEWREERTWTWKKPAHINVLEVSAGVSVVEHVGQRHPHSRFVSALDSAVAKGALSKGRSTSRLFQPLLRRSAVAQVCYDVYPVWPFCPTRLNVADDPTRDQTIRSPNARSAICRPDVDVRLLHRAGLKRFAANWIRLVLLLTCPPTVTGDSIKSSNWISPEVSSYVHKILFAGLECALHVIVCLVLLSILWRAACPYCRRSGWCRFVWCFGLLCALDSPARQASV
eukprot:s4_g44.t1